MVVGEVSVVPIGEGTSVSKFVRAAVEALRDSGVKVYPGAMSTVVEAESLDDILRAFKAAHEAVFRERAKRVIMTLVIDDRRDKKSTVEDKIKAIE